MKIQNKILYTSDVKESKPKARNDVDMKTVQNIVPSIFSELVRIEEDKKNKKMQKYQQYKNKTFNYCKNNNYDYLIISDDSGLCCDALDGEPGIHSARYAGNHNDQANRDKLRKELKDKDRTAYFVCFICLYKDSSDYKFFEGRSYGKIIDEEKGSTEFGYDSIFYSTELNKTFGEASPLEKNSVSHRGRAIEKLKEVL